MRRLLMLMILAVVAAVGQDPPADAPHYTHGLPNGLYWQSMSLSAKLGYVQGVEDGTFAALRPQFASKFGTLPSCGAQDALKWTPNRQDDLAGC